MAQTDPVDKWAKYEQKPTVDKWAQYEQVPSQQELTPEQYRELRRLAASQLPGVAGIAGSIPGVADLVATTQTTLTEQLPQALYSYVQRGTSDIQQGGDFIDRFLKSYLEERIGKEQFNKTLGQVSLGQEQLIEQSKQRQSKATKGVVTDLREIDSASSAVSFIANAVGQGLGQIPASVLTGGASSYLQESAAVYDEQLDKIAQDLGISRQEVLKRGLDRPAAGQAFAILAAGLDAVAAGKVLKLFKSAVLKNITFEAITEGAQDLLEQSGSNIGAGRGLTQDIDLGRTASATVAGGLGAGPFSFIPDQDTKIPTKIKDISPDAVKPEDITTGNPDIDQTIEELTKQSAAYVDKVVEEVDQLEGAKIEEDIATIQKNAEEMERRQQELEQKAFVLEKWQQFEQSPVVPLSQLPEGRRQATIEEEQLQAEIGAQPIQQGLNTYPTRIGEKVGQNFTFQDEAGTAKGTIVDDSASLLEIYATLDKEGTPVKGGNLYGKVIDSLRKKGIKNLVVGAQSPATQAVLSKQVERGELTIDPKGDIKIGDQTTHTRFKINDVVKQQATKADDKKDIKGVQGSVEEGQKPVKEKPIQETSSKTASPDRVLQNSIKELKDKSVLHRSKEYPNKYPSKIHGVNNEYVLPKNITYTELFNIGATRSKISINDLLPLIEELKRLNPELNTIKFQKDRDYYDFIEGIGSQYSPKDIKFFQTNRWSETPQEYKDKVSELEAKIGGRIEFAPHPDTLKQIEKNYAKKEIKKTQVTAPPKEKAAKKALKIQAKQKEKLAQLENKLSKMLDNAKKRKPSARLASYETIAQRADEANLTELRDRAAALADKELQQQQAKAEEKELRIKKKTERKPKTAPTEEQKTVRRAKRKLEVEKDKIYSQIAKAKLEGREKAAQALAKAYVKEREEQGLPATTVEKVLSKADAPHYVKAARAALTGKKKLQQGDLQKAKEAFKQDIAKELGIDPSDISSLNFTLLEKDSKRIRKEVLKFNVKGAIKEISFDEFTKFFVDAPIVQDIVNTINRDVNAAYPEDKLVYLVAQGDEQSLLGGSYFVSYSTNKHYVLVVVDKDGKPIVQNAPMHELIHPYTGLFLSRLYQYNKSFSRDINRLHTEVNTAVGLQIKSIFKKFKNFSSLSKDELRFLSILDEVVNDQGVFRQWLSRLEGTSTLLSNKEFDALAQEATESTLDNIYGLTNPEELISEAYSYSNFAKLLLLTPSIKPVGRINAKTTNVLYKLYKFLKDFLKTKIKPVKNNLYDRITDVVTKFEFYFSSDPYVVVADTASDNLKQSNIERKPTNLIKQIEKARKALSKKITNNISSTLEQRKEIKTQKDVADYITRVNARLPKTKQLGDVFVSAIWNKVQAMRKEREQAKTYQTHYLAQARNRKEYATSSKYKQDVEDFALVDIDNLKRSQDRRSDELGIYIQGLGNLAQNGFPSKQAYDVMINKGKKIQIIKELAPIADKLNQNFTKVLQDAANPASFASIISKYDPKVANTILKNIYGGTMRTMSRSGIESYNFIKHLGHVASSNNMSHKDLVTIGMVGAIFSTKNAPNTKEWVSEIKENAQFIIDASKTKLEAKKNAKYRGELSEKEIAAEIDYAQEIKNKLDKTQDISQILTPKQKKFYDEFREFSKGKEIEFERNSRGVWGNDSYEPRYNYFPTFAQGKLESGDLRDDPLLKGNSDNLFEALNDKNEEYNNIYSKKANANHKRIQPKNYFYEYDALAIASRWSKSMLYDVYASTELKAINRVLKDAEFKKHFNARTVDAFTFHLKSISKAGGKYDPTAGPFLRGLMKTRDRLYTATLATSGQLLVQSSSGFVGAAVLAANLNPLTAMKSFSKAVTAATSAMGETSKLQKFLEDNGMGIQLRDVLFEKYLTSEDYRKYLQARKLINKAENATEWALRAGDKMAARLVWFAAYFNAGGTLENPSKDAVLAAERMVGITQNMSDMNFAAPIFKYDTLSKRLLMGMFWAFKSFAINSYINLLYSTRYSWKSKEARQVAATQLGAILAYHTLQVMAIRPLYETIAEAISDSPGDDEDDEDKKQKQLKEIAGESLWEILVGPVVPEILDASARYGFNKLAAPKIFGNDYEEFDQYKDSPIFSVTDPKDIYKESLGPGFSDLAEGLDMAIILAMQAQADAAFETFEQGQKRELDEGVAWRSIIGTFLGSQRWMLMRGDVKRILNKVSSVKKRDYRNEKELMKGSSPTGQGEGAYQYPFYELDQVNF